MTSKQFNRQVSESVIYGAAIIYQREPHKFKLHSGNLKEKGSASDVIKGRLRKKTVQIKKTGYQLYKQKYLKPAEFTIIWQRSSNMEDLNRHL